MVDTDELMSQHKNLSDLLDKELKEAETSWSSPEGRRRIQGIIDGDPKLKKDIRDRLLEIAYEFIDFLGIHILITDIVMTGSLANYNWSKYSDIDLHIVANFNQFPSNQLELYKEFFTLKKMIFNKKHDITIYDCDVELYVEDESEAHFSSGVYSILFNQWANKPKRETVTIDKEKLKEKSKQWMNIIDGVIENVKDEDIDTAKELLKKYKEKIKKYRTCGLEKVGELSYENLVFKFLRRSDHMKKLMDFSNNWHLYLNAGDLVGVFAYILAGTFQDGDGIADTRAGGMSLEKIRKRTRAGQGSGGQGGNGSGGNGSGK